MNLLHAVVTSDLIAELKRRKRVRVLLNTATYYSELSSDERYMQYMDDEAISQIGRELNNKLCIRFQDIVATRDIDDRPVQTKRIATLTVIVPEDVDFDDA